MTIDVARFRLKPLLTFLVPFLLLAMLFAGTNLLAMHRLSQLRAQAENIEQDMLTDIKLISRMRSDLGRVQALAVQHVFENGEAGRTATHEKIAQTLADFESAAAEYESMEMLPGERAPWDELKAVLAGMRPRLETVLALSPHNDDATTSRQLADLHRDFERATGDLLSLIDFNLRTAYATGAQAATLQQSASTSLKALAVGGVMLLVALGVVTARVLERREAQLGLYVDRLEASNRELDAFAGRVAHDLRGPLTTATLATSRLSRQSPSAEQVKTVDVLHRSFGRMGGIIQDLLAISRAKAGESATVCDPAAAAGELREELAPRMEGGDVNVVIDVQPARVRCGEGLLRQVMWNLTDNAMKYRRAEVRPLVELCGRATEGRYELSVRDNGVGLAPDEMRKIFEPFYRADGGKSTAGTGLGLSIVKRAIEANGGTVSVSSEVGRGSTFLARLPLA
jgi:signal transduction histidine kinase